jgi:monofunctional glycosyltransferase
MRRPATVEKTAKPKQKTNSRKGKRRGWLRRLFFYFAAAAILFYAFVCGLILVLRFVAPWTTAVQIERHLHAATHGESYRKRYHCVPLTDISPHLIHAAIAAEDARFYQHHGFDWKEVEDAIQQDVEHGRRRGASTITQQLVRNLFLTTDPSVVRKALEFSLVPPTELILSKNRILELYLNVIEWGPGIYGAEAASEAYYHRTARQLSRDQAVELVSLLPAPLHRRPGKVEWYVARIRERMQQMGW